MIVKSFGCTAIHNKALNKCIIHSFIWHSFEFIFIEFKCEYVYERLYYCTLIKRITMLKKAFAVTTFGFEIKIMDKCCVCGKPPQIRSGLQTILCESKMSPCCFFTAYTYCIRSYALQTEYEPGATNLFQHPRQCHKELYDQCMAKKKPWTQDFFFFCLMSVLESL